MTMTEPSVLDEALTRPPQPLPPLRSPFAPGPVGPLGDHRDGAPLATAAGALQAPFSEALTSAAEDEEESEATTALLAELDDEDFAEALDHVIDEAAARALRSVDGWSSENGSGTGAGSAAAQTWLESVAAETDDVLARLEEAFADRPVTALSDGELEAAAGIGAWEHDVPPSPLDAQEDFLKSFLRKAKKAVRGAAKLAKRGVRALARATVGRVLRIARRLARPLLTQVLRRAKSSLPASVQPLVGVLLRRFGGEAEVGVGGGGQAVASGGGDQLARELDASMVSALTAPDEAAPAAGVGDGERAGLPRAALDGAALDGADDGDAPLDRLDAARATLAAELAEAEPGTPPTEQLERFVPAVMAAMPLLRTGIKVIGKRHVEGAIAAALARLVQGTVGRQAARQLSRHVARTGLQLLGLEAEHESAGHDPAGGGSAGTLGTEALVASIEEAAQHVLSLPSESLADELLLEAETQEAFAEAAARHLPGAVLRPEVAERGSAAEGGVWVLMPRAARPHYRYRKYSRVLPVRLTRGTARALALADGDNLERRVLAAGAAAWPVAAELELFELLPGGVPGHVAAFEADPGQSVVESVLELEELDEAAATLLAGDPGLAGGRGRRLYRLRAGGRPLRRRRPLALRLDTTASSPVVVLDVRLGEREAHTLSAQLERRALVQVVATVRSLLDPAARRALATRLERLMTRHGAPPTSAAAQALAQKLADAAVRAVAAELPAAAPALAQAARDPAPGVTLSFGFTFGPANGSGGGGSLAGLTTATPQGPTLRIRAGGTRG